MSVAAGVAAQTLAAAVPLALAGSGEVLSQRAGVLNVGIEGLMLTGCITAYGVAATTGSPWLGLVAAILAATVLAGAFAAATVWGRVDQIVAGMAINLLAVGISGTAWASLQAGGHDHLPAASAFAPFGPGILHQHGLFWVACLALVLTAVVLRRSRAGIVIAAIGDAPDAAAAAGIAVRGWRTALILVAGGLAGAAGAYLSIMRTHVFVTEMTGGLGFLVLALVIFGRWTGEGLALGCLLFGLIEALQQLGQAWGWTQTIPWQAFKALPYGVALLALVVFARSAPGPRAMNQPWPSLR